MRSWLTPSITHPFTGARARLAQGLGLLLTPLLGVVLAASAQAQSGDRELFVEAWESARAGDRSVFEAAGPQLTGYLLYPYWQYEDYRARRSRVPAAEMAAFLDAHEDWAFTAGLKKAWLTSLGKRGRWADLLAYGSESFELSASYESKLKNLRTVNLWVKRAIETFCDIFRKFFGGKSESVDAIEMQAEHGEKEEATS